MARLVFINQYSAYCEMMRHTPPLPARAQPPPPLSTRGERTTNDNAVKERAPD